MTRSRTRQVHLGNGATIVKWFIRRGFSLVELLVVILIMAILIALMLPAINAARESARRATCQSHLRQIGLACIQHETSHGYYPSCGWGWHWVGDPDRGFGASQPGGWVYDILGYIEENELREIGAGLPLAEKSQALKQLLVQPIPIMNCPSRRSSLLFPNHETPINADHAEAVSRSDYAINSGSIHYLGNGIGKLECLSTYPDCDLDHQHNKSNGVSHERSEVRQGQVVDGTSQTLLVGEKHLPPSDYFSGNDSGDNASMYTGYDYDTSRWTGTTIEYAPRRDSFEDGWSVRFGSAHPSGMSAVFIDGSVRLIAYNIDLRVYAGLGSRSGSKSAGQ